MTALNLAMPGNPRYQPKDLQPYFGYDNLFREAVNVEVATFQSLANIEVIPHDEAALLTAEVIEELRKITTTEIDEIERKITKHDVRALVMRIQQIVHKRIGRWIHVPNTSMDVLDTARILQFLHSYQKVIRPKTKRVILQFCDLVEKFAETLQIGRTHGQHALPITVGFWLANILYRIMYNAQKMELHSHELVGKISGAVGACNAQHGLGFVQRSQDATRVTFEELVLSKLGLKPSPISCQILPPEPLAYYLHSAVMLSASFGQFGRDCRNLMRSEIGEVVESFGENQVGSSTMAHKRNPITFENLEGTWEENEKEYGKVLGNLISDHQRDLVGSSVSRDFPTIIVYLCYQLDRLLQVDEKTGKSFLQRISIDTRRCEENLRKSGDKILAEPVYIALQMAGYEGDAHHLVNHVLIPTAQNTDTTLMGCLEIIADQKGGELKEAFQRIPEDVKKLLQHPDQYTGLASQKALEIAQLGRQFAGKE